MLWEMSLTCFCGFDWFCELSSAAQRVPFVGFFGWSVPYWAMRSKFHYSRVGRRERLDSTSERPRECSRTIEQVSYNTSRKQID